MTAQLPTIRLTVAKQMEAYRQRIADAIDRELKRQGKSESDLAHAVGTEKRTVERWTAAERTPQRRHRKPIADYLGVPMEVLYPDLEAEEQALREQLDRIEQHVHDIDGMLRALGAALLPLDEVDDDVRRYFQERSESPDERREPGQQDSAEG